MTSSCVLQQWIMFHKLGSLQRVMDLRCPANGADGLATAVIKYEIATQFLLENTKERL
jgi:hypothetical protein